MAVTGINNLDLSCFVFTDPSIDGSFTYSAFVHRLYVSQCQLSSDFMFCAASLTCAGVGLSVMICLSWEHAYR